MAFKLDITAKDIEESVGKTFEPLSPGVYGAIIVESVVKNSKKGNLMYANNYRITGGPEGIDRKIRGWHVIQGPGAFSSASLLKALGLPYIKKGMTEQELADFEFPDGDELIGQELNLKIKNEPYKGMDDNGDEITKYQDSIGGTFPYDEDKHTEPEEDEEDSGGGGLLG